LDINEQGCLLPNHAAMMPQTERHCGFQTAPLPPLCIH
jgi:hypothetical protein